MKSFLAQHNCGYYDETILITYLFHESIKFRSHRVTYTNTMTRSDNHKNEISINDNIIDIDESSESGWDHSALKALKESTSYMLHLKGSFIRIVGFEIIIV